MSKINIPQNILEYSELWMNMSVDYVCENWDKRLYHILPYEYFLNILKTNSLYLVNILDKWRDEPYELFYYKPKYFRRFESKDIKLDVRGVANRFYAQCWSLNKDSNAMWRIYSGKDYDGVRIATTLGDIVSLLYPIHNKEQYPYIGFMKYEWKKDIKQWLTNHSSLTFLDWLHAANESLFIKRKNFNYEKEFRIVISTPTMDDGGRQNKVQDHFSIPIKLNEFIKEISLSPFIDKNLRNEHYKEIFEYVQDSSVKVNQSLFSVDDISDSEIIIL